jgi:hypothetical protein
LISILAAVLPLTRPGFRGGFSLVRLTPSSNFRTGPESTFGDFAISQQQWGFLAFSAPANSQQTCRTDPRRSCRNSPFQHCFTRHMAIPRTPQSASFLARPGLPLSLLEPCPLCDPNSGRWVALANFVGQSLMSSWCDRRVSKSRMDRAIIPTADGPNSRIQSPFP